MGENILLKYKIYQSSNHIRNLEITDYDLPMSNDFWTELIEPKNKQWKESQEIINGISFRVFTLKKEIISPQKSGKLTIPAFEVSTVINRDFFNRGVSKFYLGDMIGACKDARKAQELGDDASILIKKACN